MWSKRDGVDTYPRYAPLVHTVIVSDMHLAEAHDPEPRRPLWMAYKRREYFIDDDFAALLTHLDRDVEGPVELVLNGDIFDFDAILEVPDDGERPVDWLARLRGLSSEAWMSAFKMECIIRDHPVWFDALRSFLDRGHRVVFVLGNHDLELNWPEVQRLVLDALGVAEAEPEGPVRFCSWFYLSEGDTYISHGHQYDPNCVAEDPIDPLIEVHGRPRVRIPFGDIANRYMLNGMGYFNPHATDNYIMTGRQYAWFFLRYMLRTQPLLVWSWFWSAVATLVITLRDHLKPAMRDPLLVEEKTRRVAAASRATPAQVRRLAALHAPSSCTHPLGVLQELWLDRGFLLMGVMFLAWQVVLHINIAWPISPLWVFAAIAVLFPPYLVYASRVKSSVFDKPLLDERRAELIHAITGATTVVFGHTHEPVDEQVGPVRYINGGFWSPAFAEPECTTRIGTQSFVWLQPQPTGERRARLYEWPHADQAPRPFVLEASTSHDRATKPPPSRASHRPQPNPS